MEKAAFYTGRRNFTVRQVERKTPGNNQVAVRVSYCGICGSDLHIFHGLMDERVRPPKITGHEMSGTVTGIGEGVTAVRIGDRVVVRPLDW